jgi:hypothetical protein
MVGSGQLGGSLMNEAMRRMALQGRLSDQDARDVTQATRQGLAARGMAMGNAALGAELLNRDRFTRQRAFQDLGFAQGIQEQDLNRQQLNSNRALEAARANQSVAAQMSLAELDAEMRARQSNQQTATNLSLADLDAEMRARTANQSTAANMSIAQGQIDQNNNQFNAQQLTGNDRFNVGLLEQSAVRADQERLRQLGLGQDAYNFSMATDPKLMAVGLGNPYANLTGSTQAASQVLGTIAMNPMYSGGNAGTQGQNMQLIGTLGGGALAAGGTVAGAVII